VATMICEHAEEIRDVEPSEDSNGVRMLQPHGQKHASPHFLINFR